jgi:hypothetical protein
MRRQPICWEECDPRRAINCETLIEVPTVGLLQMMKDPQGAAFYIIQPESTEERPETAPEVGEASWHELMTTDAPAAMKFYSEILNGPMEVPGGDWVVNAMDPQGAAFSLHAKKPQ